jgi:hypothetical protein
VNLGLSAQNLAMAGSGPNMAGLGQYVIYHGCLQRQRRQYNLHTFR